MFVHDLAIVYTLLSSRVVQLWWYIIQFVINWFFFEYTIITNDRREMPIYNT